MRKIILLAMILLLALGLASAEESIYPSTIGSLNATVTMTGNGSITGLKEGQEARLQIITFSESEFQKIKPVKEELHINGKTIYPQYVLDKFGNKYLLFHINENGPFDYAVVADVNVKALTLNISDYQIGNTSPAAEQYISPSIKVESATSEILTLAANKTIGDSYFEVLGDTIDWTNNYVEYASGDDFRKYYLEQKSAVETLLSKKGVCDEFANLAAAILRAKKIPTRIAIGITFDGQRWGNHAWIETYHEKQKVWIPSDPTFRETGFVDAMHIKMGSFLDVTDSKANCNYPDNANCFLQGQTEFPQVTVNEKQYFREVTISAPEQKLTANKWNDTNFTIKNNTNGTISAPIKMIGIQEVLTRGDKQTILLSPGEEKAFIIKLLPKIAIQRNQQAQGEITINSLSQPVSVKALVTYGSEKEGDVVIEDITPIAHDGELRIQISATNYYDEAREILVKINDGNYSSQNNYSIPAQSSKITTEEINNYEESYYDVNITTPTAIYLQRIIPVKQGEMVPQDTNRPTIIEQEVPIQQKPPSITQTIIDTPIAVVAGVLIGIIVLLFGLFYVNRRYV